MGDESTVKQRFRKGRLGVVLGVLAFCAVVTYGVIEKDLAYTMFFKKRYHVPAETASLKSFGQAEQHCLQAGETYHVLIWNIHKCLHPDWQRDFAALQKDYDFLVLQEALIRTEDQSKNVYQRGGFHCVFATSYINTKHVYETGLLTAAHLNVNHAEYFRSSDREPLTKTPKSILTTYFEIENRPDPLLLINAHFLNFKTTKAVGQQLAQIEAAVREHPGPVILAGDFNTWKNSRSENLHKLAAECDLKLVPLREDSRLLKLDHLFTRHVSVKNARLLNSITSSDHVPLSAEIAIDD